MFKIEGKKELFTCVYAFFGCCHVMFMVGVEVMVRLNYVILRL